MANALLSPAVGGTMWAVSAGTIAYCARRVKDELDERKAPLIGFPLKRRVPRTPAAGDSSPPHRGA